jgi:hypothetical protein
LSKPFAMTSAQAMMEAELLALALM